MTSSKKNSHCQARLSFSLLLFLFCFSHALARSDPPIPAGEVRIHYFRPDGNYGGWAANSSQPILHRGISQ
jgi:hypothetical protein